MELTLGGGGAGAPADLIKDSDTARFVKDVLEASRQVPVIVDFWATWCGPCKTLGPALEKLVRQAGGKVRLVKIDVDRNQDLAAQMRIKSVPAVYAFKDGRPVDGFTGALPESQIKSFIDRLVGGGGNQIDEALAAAREMIEHGDPAGASAVYAEILGVEPEQPGAIAGMIRCFLAVGETARARQTYDGLNDKLKANGEIAGALAALELAEHGDKAGDVTELLAKVQLDPKNHQARFDLAVALFAKGQRDTAMDELLELIRRDKNWNDQAGRKQLVQFFEAMGPTDPLTIAGRKRLSSLLFA